MTKENFAQIMLVYAQILPKGAPDFTNPIVLDYWYHVFKHVSPFVLKAKMDEWVGSKSFYPTIAELKDLLGEKPASQDETADKIANLIRSSISKYGYPNERDARQEIGEVGWEVVRRMGGWVTLCQSFETHEELNYAFRNFKDLAKVVLNGERRGDLQEAPSFDKPQLSSPLGKALAISAGGSLK